MNSSLYLGWVRHRRRSDVTHGFRYPVFMSFLDLDELPTAFRTHPAWRLEMPAPAAFHRADYLGRTGNLKAAVLDEAESVLGRRPAGPVRMLTNLRSWGYAFNPVTFYYCYEADGATVAAVVAEITNTPWGERHRYVTTNSDDGLLGRFAKVFHVSPFQPMDHAYRWRFTPPGSRLGVHMVNSRDGVPVFDATLVLRRRPWSSAWLGRVLWRFPHITLFTIAAIHWQALRLWWKGARFHAHPQPRPTAPILAP
jgi:DUF1365 family protein